jgi:L-asparaginase II
MGWDVAGYTEPAHPLQRLIMDNFTKAAGLDAPDLQLGVDGCSAPSPALPLLNTARAFATLARDQRGRRLLNNMAAHPFYVAGDKRFDTALMQAFPGRFAAKTGAEGNQVVIDLARGGVLCVKAADGQTRAALAATGHALLQLGWIDDDSGIADFTRPRQKNWRGIETGDITAF